MSVLIAYGSKHGATRRIAERIGDALRNQGVSAEVRPASGVTDLDGYEAFVIGGAVYFGSWLKEVTRFLEHHQTVLAERPCGCSAAVRWVSSRPTLEGRDLRDTSVPKQLDILARAVHARGHRVFLVRSTTRSSAYVSVCCGRCPPAASS